MSADVVGYSRMMEADEQGTLARLKANRSSIFDPEVAAHGGRIVKLIGDGALAEFASVVSAVECALAIQSATTEAGRDLPEARRLRYRIGVNLGDVIVEGDDIYGDGVNVAARIQALAEPDGVAVSSTVRDHMSGKVDAEFKDMGEHTVKNIERPIRVFAVRPKPAAPKSARLSICVLPFANMSDDPQQEYFSDGISEDIITDLSKVSSLGVIARNTAFQFKAKSVDVPVIAKQLKVSHILEGSVRKAGARLRITAQLIDGASGEHVWAERYDRNLDDIFALQDEISEAIVKALKLKLLPEEKKAIERRGTNSVEAYNLYLLARQTYASGFEADVRHVEGIVRIAKRATEVDPNYAQAWALLALGQMVLRYVHNKGDEDDGLAAAERALTLDTGLAEPHAVKARIFAESGRQAEAISEIEIALKIDPESYEVNKSAGRLYFGQRQLEEAIRHWEKAASLMESDFSSLGLLVTCYTAIGNKPAAQRAAQRTLASAEKILAQDRNNGAAMGHSSLALSILGQTDRAKDMMNRALLVDPDNLNMRYNFVCALASYSADMESALDMLEPLMAKLPGGLVEYCKIDPDLDPIREHPRFKAMLAQAETRIAAETKAKAN